MPRKPPRYDLPHTAPEPLRGVQLLVNTWDAEHCREVAPMKDELRRWLRARGVEAGDADLERLGRLRETLRALLVANNEGGDPPRKALTALNTAAAASPLALRFEPDGVELAARDAVGAVLAAAYAAIAEGTWPRLKACRNCHWAFYDTSKNRSGTWCSMQLCGNRLKTRRFRSRQVAH